MKKKRIIYRAEARNAERGVRMSLVLKLDRKLRGETRSEADRRRRREAEEAKRQPQPE